MSDKAAQRAAVDRPPAGFPGGDDAAAGYQDADFNRAVQAYRLFYPSVSGLASSRATRPSACCRNEVFGLLETQPGARRADPELRHPLRSRAARPARRTADDRNAARTADLHRDGREPALGGRHGTAGSRRGQRRTARHLPARTTTARFPRVITSGRSTAYRVLVGIRSLPVGGDIKAATERITTVKVLSAARSVLAGVSRSGWTSRTCRRTPRRSAGRTTSATGMRCTRSSTANRRLTSFRSAYGELAALGIAKGQPFAPDARMRSDPSGTRRQDRPSPSCAPSRSPTAARPHGLAWPPVGVGRAAVRERRLRTPGLPRHRGPRKVVLPGHRRVAGHVPPRHPRRVAVLARPARRRGAYLDGSRGYRLTVPLPVPGKLFWSVTVYDARTRSQVQTEQGRALLSSLFDFARHQRPAFDRPVLRPDAPPGGQGGRWVQTRQDAGWFTYFRIYGPEQRRLRRQLEAPRHRTRHLTGNQLPLRAVPAKPS